MGRNADKRRRRRTEDDRSPDPAVAAASPVVAASAALAPAQGRTTSGWRAQVLDLDLDSLAVEPPSLGMGLFRLSMQVAMGASLPTLAERVAVLLGADRAGFLDVGDDFAEKGATLAGAWRKYPGEDRAPAFDPALGADLLKDVIGGAVVHIPDVARDARLVAGYGSRNRVGALLLAPMRHGGTLRRVLGVGRTEVMGFLPNDALALAAIADALALDLDQAEHLERGLSDPTTGILGRQALLLHLRRECERARRYQLPLTLALVDIDGLDSLNQSGGRAAGDAALRAVAERLASLVRSADLAFATGAGHFALLLPHVALDEAMSAVDRAIHLLGAEDTEGAVIQVSAGLAGLSQEISPLELFERAERALLRAKSEGGGRLAVARPPAR